MSYFVTGATGFIGRFLVEELLDHREGEVFVLVREGSLHRLEALVRHWGTDRVVPVVGELSTEALGVDPAWVAEHRGEVEHFFHLAAIYDMTADDATNEAMNVGGTRHALALAADLDVGCFHQVSSVAAAGEHQGPFDETMFAEGQHLPSPYHRTKYESERIVREEGTVPWRVYRPSIVVGDSETGAMDKVDGPYYFFALMKTMRDVLPAWLPLAGVDMGDTNVVPVDYVARAMDHLAHLPGRDGEAFHLVNPEPQPVVDMINAFCAAAGAPTFATRARPRPGPPPAPGPPARRRSSAAVGQGRRRCRPRSTWLTSRVGVPAEVLAHTSFTAVFDSRRTERALAGSGIAVPDLESYARTLCSYWEEHLDETTGTRPSHPRGAAGQARGHHRRLLRHRAGHRPQGRPGRRRPGAGGARQGQARGGAGGHRAARRHGAASTPATSPTSRRSTGCASSWPPSCPRSTSWSTTRGAPSGARCDSPTTASTTSSAPCSSTTSARSGW